MNSPADVRMALCGLRYDVSNGLLEADAVRNRLEQAIQQHQAAELVGRIDRFPPVQEGHSAQVGGPAMRSRRQVDYPGASWRRQQQAVFGQVLAALGELPQCK